MWRANCKNYAQINPHIVQKSTVVPNETPAWGLSCCVVSGMSFPLSGPCFCQRVKLGLDVVTPKGLSSFTIQERGPKPSDLIILNHHRFVVAIFSAFRNI